MNFIAGTLMTLAGICFAGGVAVLTGGKGHYGRTR